MPHKHQTSKNLLSTSKKLAYFFKKILGALNFLVVNRFKNHATSLLFEQYSIKSDGFKQNLCIEIEIDDISECLHKAEEQFNHETGLVYQKTHFQQ